MLINFSDCYRVVDTLPNNIEWLIVTSLMHFFHENFGNTRIYNKNIYYSPMGVACWPVNALIRHSCHCAGHKFKPHLTYALCLGTLQFHLEVILEVIKDMRIDVLPILPIARKKHLLFINVWIWIQTIKWRYG